MELPDRIRTLSKVEANVLMLVCLGYTNRQIIEELDSNDKTLTSQLTRIYLKMDVGGENDEKRNALLNYYCDTFKKIVTKESLRNWKPNKPPPEEETKYALIEYRYPDPKDPEDPKGPEDTKPKKKLPPPKPIETIRLIDEEKVRKILILVGGIIVALILVIVFLLKRPPESPLISPTQAPENTQTPLPTYTTQPTYTIQPTYTPLPTIAPMVVIPIQAPTTTDTLTVKLTSVPTPNILIQGKFADGIPNGLKVDGAYQIVDGSLTSQGPQAVVISAGDQSWKNYDVQLSFTAFDIDACGFSFGVRGKDRNNVIALRQTRAGRMGWYTVVNGVAKSTGTESLVPFAPMVMEVIVNGDHFTWVGQFDFVLPGHPQGGVILELTCAKMDGITISALP